MKPFQRGNPQTKVKLPGSSTATTVSVQSNLSAGENGSAIILSPNHGDFNNNDDNMTQETSLTQNSSKRHLFPLLDKKLKLLRQGNNKQNSVTEARQRAAKRLEPPPFTESNVNRLQELKEAKSKAEERAEERGGGRNGGSGSSVVSTNTATTFGSDEEHEVLVKRDALIFLSSLFLHMILLPLRHYSPTPLLLLALQSTSLWGLLNSVLVYAFDCIDFGQMELVKNMNYGKKLFVEEVRKYSFIVAVSVAAVSCSCAVGGRIFQRSANGMCHLLGHLWESPTICVYGGVPTETWVYQAFQISSFLSSRLGVFVLALLLMGHALLPKPGRTTKVQKAASCDNHRSQRGQKKHHGALTFSVSFLLAVTITTATASSSSNVSPLSSQTPSQKAIQSILVAGSLNADTFLPIHRFPSPGENLTLLPNQQPLVDVPGGKGCNQAIACAKLSKASSSGNHESGNTKVAFLGQFGNDSASKILQTALLENNVDISTCGHSKLYPSGRGYVMIVPETGEVSAVVSGGSNLYGWGTWGVKNHAAADDDNDEQILTDEQIQDLVSSHSLLLLQCEVPHLVNLRLAQAARKLNVPVIVDVGGEDRTMEPDLLECCDYLVPNETELDRLARSYQEEDVLANRNDPISNNDGMAQQMEEIQAQIGVSLHLPSILKSVQTLQENGASNVLVTLGSCGSILVKKEQRSILYQPSCNLPSASTVVDETGAGDCYRAGFAVALLEHCKGSIMDGDDVDDAILQQCMKFASSAGALAVTRKGAVPSIPSRREVEDLLLGADSNRNDPVEVGAASTTLEAVPRGGDDNFPFLFGSRINSMKDRLDLVDSSSLPIATPRDYLLRQATIRGLGCVDFNYPQHFGDWTPEEAKQALDEVNLVAGAVCLRYPSKFARGAMIHPDAELRREAIEITKRAAEAARILGCNEVVVWSAYDGYDYSFQVNYQEKWNQIVHAFQECCDAYPDIKWSLEFKPTDENTRFFTVPSTGAAMLLVQQIDRPNMGLTLDMGHMLMAGENPGQSIAMVGEKLFGIQLNDGYTRLAAEDGMMFGSIHPSIALETMYQLSRINFQGHFYFDTFPQRTDPVKEAEYNIRRVKEFWRAVGEMDGEEVERIAREHDAIGALELVNEALRR